MISVFLMDDTREHHAIQSSLSRRFIMILTGVVAGIMILFSSVMAFWNARNDEKRLEQQLARTTLLAETSLASAVWQVNAEMVRDVLTVLLTDEAIAYASVNADGENIVEKIRPDFSQYSWAFFQNSADFTTRQTAITKNGMPIGIFRIAVARENIRIQRWSNLFVTLILTLLLVLTCSVTTLLISRRYILNPLTSLVHSAASVAHGEFDTPMIAALMHLPHDEIGELARTFDEMRQRLQYLLEHLGHAAATMQSSSEEILTAVNQLAAALEEQSAAVVETTAMMESVTSTSRQISGNTDTVATMAEQTKGSAQIGVEMVEATIEKMRNIMNTNTQVLQNIMTLGKRSEKIGDVIELINDIADRTKLLAFNAALEAVDGNENSGKRFHIIAMEIRRLADSIIESTEEISSNILEIQQGIQQLVQSSDITTSSIQEGTQQTSALSNGLQEILSAALRTTNEAKQIASATQEQQHAHEQILFALKEISENARQFASAGNQVSLSAHEMKHLADTLHHLLLTFRRGDHDEERDRLNAPSS